MVVGAIVVDDVSVGNGATVEGGTVVVGAVVGGVTDVALVSPGVVTGVEPPAGDVVPVVPISGVTPVDDCGVDPMDD